MFTTSLSNCKLFCWWNHPFLSHPFSPSLLCLVLRKVCIKSKLKPFPCAYWGLQEAKDHRNTDDFVHPLDVQKVLKSFGGIQTSRSCVWQPIQCFWNFSCLFLPTPFPWVDRFSESFRSGVSYPKKTPNCTFPSHMKDWVEAGRWGMRAAKTLC